MRKTIENPRRTFLVKALSLGLIAGTGMTYPWQAANALGRIPNRLPDGRSIYRLEGEVTVDGKQANLNTPIGPNSVIKTGSNSLAIFVVADGAFILRSNSQLEMGSEDGLLVQGFAADKRQARGGDGDARAPR